MSKRKIPKRTRSRKHKLVKEAMAEFAAQAQVQKDKREEEFISCSCRAVVNSMMGCSRYGR
jgi:hypothetical protein